MTMSPIAPTDIQYELSGGATNIDPQQSLGGAISTAQIVSAQDDALFDDVPGVEAQTGATEYRGAYAKNAHATLVLAAAVLWIDQPTTSPDSELDVAVAAQGPGQAMATTPNSSTPPTGVVFARPVTKATGLPIGDIPAGSFQGFWLRRTVLPGADAAADQASVRVEGYTQ